MLEAGLTGFPAAEFKKWLNLGGDFGACRRKRLYTPARTFWLFLSQVMSGDCSCRETTRGFLGRLCAGKALKASVKTAGYCKARVRLPVKDIMRVNRTLVRKIGSGEGRWRGREVKVIDGTCVSMPDTIRNGEIWPQPKGAKAGCGFPVMRLVAMFSLFSGVMVDCSLGSLHAGERRLFRRLWRILKPGEVVLGDRGFCDYASFWLLGRFGVDCVMRKHQRREGKAIRRFGKGDYLMEWRKNGNKPAWLSGKDWESVPASMLVREIKVNVNIKGFRTKIVTIATTLTDYRSFRAQDFAYLYFKRWSVELYLRDIKGALGMDVLRCKSPEMVVKELWMKIIGYNLIRAVMLEAGRRGGVSAGRLSFEGTLGTLRQWLPLLSGPDTSKNRRDFLYGAMLDCIARDEVPLRPGRSEPRARKRRPKKYQLLTRPREVFHETPHRGRYVAA